MSLIPQSFRHLFGDRASSIAGHLLGQQRNHQPLLANELAFVRLDLASDQSQQRALAFPIAAHQAKPLTPLDLQRDLIEQPRTSKGQADVP